ncbi:MAG: hypothetical protein HY831_02800 [Candidatus Aenigmarchaeota archaeon]|nr:hypothetical protein [Candidatus Aenigmarchaeota archaeon]
MKGFLVTEIPIEVFAFLILIVIVVVLVAVFFFGGLQFGSSAGNQLAQNIPFGTG